MSFANHQRPTRRARRRRLTVLLLVCSSLLALLAGCDQPPEEVAPVADYGNLGAQYARKIAMDTPRRGPFTAEERQAAEIIRVAWEKMGYTPQWMPFTVQHEDGAVWHSQNVVVRIPGHGFRVADANSDAVREVRRQVIVGAHYDTWFSEPRTDAQGEPLPPVAGADYEACVEAYEAGYDGINDNASGIGALLALARELYDTACGYDVVLVAFGAGCADQAGAAHYVAQMTAQEVAQTDAMYCVEALYAGDKLYASAGLNSLARDRDGNPAKIYEKRRKLYEATDVAIVHDLDELGFDLLTNQSSLRLDLDGDDAPDVYREVTLTRADHLPFDAAGIPCVYLESYNYAYDNLAAMRDARNHEMADWGGIARRNTLDSYTRLSAIFADMTRLKDRINHVAFILYEAIVKGYWEALP